MLGNGTCKSILAGGGVPVPLVGLEGVEHGALGEALELGREVVAPR